MMYFIGALLRVALVALGLGILAVVLVTVGILKPMLFALLALAVLAVLVD